MITERLRTVPFRERRLAGFSYKSDERHGKKTSYMLDFLLPLIFNHSVPFINKLRELFHQTYRERNSLK